MRRGFKTWAEKESAKCRSRLGIAASGRLPARQLLQELGAVVVTPSKVAGLDPGDLRQLTEIDPTAWSAVTVPVEGRHLVIVNDAHGEARQESNLHHEAAHLLCEHKPAELQMLGGFAFRGFDVEAEEEAAWLGGCLHLPRLALLGALRQGQDHASIARQFVVSPEMIRWRRSKTGVDRQLGGGRS